MPSDEFPNIKNTEEDAKKLTFDKLKFADMIRKTSFAASIDQTKGVITGILLEISNDNIKMVAIDGYRMAITSEEMVNKEDHRIIISAKIMNEISKNGWHKEEPLDNVKATHPTCLRNAYKLLLDNNIVSKNTLMEKLYNENMILHPDDLEILMGLKEGTLVDKKDVKVLSFNNKKRK